MQKKGKTLVVGLGEVGGALATVLERTAPILKLDIEPQDFGEPIEVMHLCVPFTGKSRFEEIALSYIERFKPALTIVNSTVLPGTTRTIAQRCAPSGRLQSGAGKRVRMAQDLLHYRKFVAASEPETARLAEEHLQQAGMQTHRVSQLKPSNWPSWRRPPISA